MALISSIIALLMWSITALFLTFCTNVPPFQASAVMFLIAVLSILTGQKLLGHDIKSNWLLPWRSYIFPTFGIIGYMILLLIGFANAPTFIANSLNYLWPILMFVFAVILTRSPLKPNQIISILLGLIGTIILFSKDLSDIQSNSYNLLIGSTASLLAAILWAFYSVQSKKSDFPTGGIAPVFAIGSVICLVVTLIFEDFYLPNTTEILFLFLLGITRTSFLFWNYGIKNGSLTQTASLSYFVPTLSMLILVMCGFKASSIEIAIAAGLITIASILGNIDNIFKKNAS